MKWPSLLLGLHLLVCGCAAPYAGAGYNSRAKYQRAGVAADAQPQDVQAALQKYLATN